MAGVEVAPRAPALTPRPLGGRLGLDLPADWWPTGPAAKAWEAAGFGWLQICAPPAEVLLDWRAAACHSTALRNALAAAPPRLAVRAPVDVSPAAPGGARRLDALLEYAAELGAEIAVCPALDVRVGGDPGLLDAEEAVLRAAARRAERLGVTLALENGAPAWPGRPRVGHDLAEVHALVGRLASPRLRLCLDVGHAHVVADLQRRPLVDAIAPVLGEAALVHLHDNLGARRASPGPPGLSPLRLDVHLAPGAGTLPWGDVRPLLAGLRAPLVLEVAPPHRPAPLSLATVAAELLLRPR